MPSLGGGQRRAKVDRQHWLGLTFLNESTLKWLICLFVCIYPGKLDAVSAAGDVGFEALGAGRAPFITLFESQ